MDLIWKLPGESPNPKAIERMRRHFPMPKEPMPEAWFVSGVNFYTPDPYGNALSVCDTLNQIRSGVVIFSEMPYVSVWKAWFLHLLPDLIIRANEPENLNDSSRDILTATITTFFSLYPRTILSEYPGFREDVVSTLGTRAIPPHLAREALPQREEQDRLFTDIWDIGPMIESFGFPSLDEVNSSLLFCVKHLTPDEIQNWAVSLFQIDSPQWHLQLIFSFSEWRKFNVLNTPWFVSPKTPYEFIPPDHARAFEQVLSQHLSFEIFKAWREEVLRHLNITPYNMENKFYLSKILEEELQSCEAILFPNRGMA
jgi:hypothetical protein